MNEAFRIRTWDPTQKRFEERHLHIVQRIRIQMMGQRMRNSPFFVIEERQVEIQHSEVIASMKEIVGRYDGVAQTETGQHHHIFIVESGGHR